MCRLIYRINLPNGQSILYWLYIINLYVRMCLCKYQTAAWLLNPGKTANDTSIKGISIFGISSHFKCYLSYVFFLQLGVMQNISSWNGGRNTSNISPSNRYRFLSKYSYIVLPCLSFFICGIESCDLALNFQ